MLFCYRRQEHQHALIQLQDASSQLAALQPQLVKLQLEKQDLRQQLADADAEKCSLQQQLAEQMQQHAAAKEQLLSQLQKQQQMLTEAAEAERAAKAEAATAEARLAALTQQQQERQQQQAQQLLMQTSVSHQHELEQVLQRLQWLCSAYLSPSLETDAQQSPATQKDSSSSKQAADAASDSSSFSAAAALSKLQKVCCLAGSDTDKLLSARYDAYEQHKLGVAPGQHALVPGCDRGSGPSDVAGQVQVQQASPGMECLQQQLLQLEAGLLQHMLNLQEAVQLLHQQQQEQQQQLQQRVMQSQRPGTASSRCTESCSTVGSCCSSSSRGRSCDLTGQLLQAMANDRKQLAQEVKRLQAQQHQQQRGQQRYLQSSRNSYSCDVGAKVASLYADEAGSSSLVSFGSVAANDTEVDEVLQLLQGYEVQGCQQERRTPARATAAPTRELHKRGIGSLRSRMLG
jgi:hypothetical protein